MDVNNEKLQGKLALVHPDLLQDPAGRQNQAGRIVSANIDADDFLVSFLDGRQALYAADALLVWKQPEEIFEMLESTDKDMTNPVIRNSYGIASLLYHRIGPADRSCVKHAVDHNGVRDICMETLRDLLDREQSRSTER